MTSASKWRAVRSSGSPDSKARDEMDTGMRGEAAFRRVKEDGPSGIMVYGYKFRPVIEQAFVISRIGHHPL